MDYFPSDDISILVVSILFAIFLLTILPLIAMIARNQAFNFMYDDTDKLPSYARFIFNIILVLGCIGCGIFGIEPNFILG